MEEELLRICKLQIDNCKQFAGTENNDYYEGAVDAYQFIIDLITKENEKE